MWKDIPGYEGLYQASTSGEIRSLITEKFLKIKIRNDGKAEVCLFKEKMRKYILVGRLIAKTFISNPEGKERVLHIDGDKTNNTIENLRWATIQEVNLHTANRYDRNVVEFEGKRFNSETAAARAYGIEPELFRSRKQIGWSLEENLKIKRGVIKGRPYLYKYLGKVYTLKELAEMKGTTRWVLQKRLSAGWGLCEAVEVPVIVKKRKEK